MSSLTNNDTTLEMKQDIKTYINGTLMNGEVIRKYIVIKDKKIKVSLVYEFDGGHTKNSTFPKVFNSWWDPYGFSGDDCDIWWERFRDYLTSLYPEFGFHKMECDDDCGFSNHWIEGFKKGTEEDESDEEDNSEDWVSDY